MNLRALKPYMLSGSKRLHDKTRAEATEQFNEFIESLGWRIEYAKSIVQSSGIAETGDHREYVRAMGEWLTSVGELDTISVAPNPKFGYQTKFSISPFR